MAEQGGPENIHDKAPDAIVELLKIAEEGHGSESEELTDSELYHVKADFDELYALHQHQVGAEPDKPNPLLVPKPEFARLVSDYVTVRAVLAAQKQKEMEHTGWDEIANKAGEQFAGKFTGESPQLVHETTTPTDGWSRNVHGSTRVELPKINEDADRIIKDLVVNLSKAAIDGDMKRIDLYREELEAAGSAE